MQVNTDNDGKVNSNENEISGTNCTQTEQVLTQAQREFAGCLILNGIGALRQTGEVMKDRGEKLGNSTCLEFNSRA